jgi:Right handed beta helix region
MIVGDPAKAGELPVAILDAYAKGARDITIAPGVYRIPPAGKCAISLERWKDVTIHAKGVTLVFEELKQRPIRLNRCENVTLEGATLLFAEPSFTQGRIKAIGEDAQGKYLDWQIDAGYPVFDAAKSMLDVVDQKTRLLKTGTGDAGCKGVESLGPSFFRLRQPNGLLGSATVGDWLFTRRPGGGDSIIHLDGCSHCTLRGITLQNSGFAAFFETGGEGGHHYVDCRVAPGPKPAGATEEQLVGCGADGFHSAGTRQGPTIERCAWEGLLHDDCIAIHGSLQKVQRAEGKTLILEKGNRGGFAVGEPVRISSKDGFFGEFTCTALRTLDQEGGLLELTLDRESAALGEAKASNPLHDGTGYKILNCTLGNCRSRGILVKADNGIIEGCTISGCGMSAISIGPEYWWGEADYSHNVIVKGNTLRNNVLNGSGAGVIFVHGDGAIGNKNITITSNLFDMNYGQIGIYAEDTDGIRIADNRFITSPIPLPGKTRTILDFKSTKNITLQRNLVANSATDDILVNLGKNVDEIIGNDAAGIVTMKTNASDSAPTSPSSKSR